ncbi:MAG: CRTAC1 family protein [Gammaproteobacteria bacterium]
MPVFSERGAELGIGFEHFNGMLGKFYFPEIVGAGAALFDCDNDGDLDLYLVQGATLEEGEARSPRSAGRILSDQLYRNDRMVQADGTPRLYFTDITAASGIQEHDYGMGAAAGDIDNDGFVDLYVTNFGANRVWHNEGNCTFKDWTVRAGVGDPRWSVSAAFFDYDRDGWLDLFVGNYVDFTLANHRPCYAPTSAQDYCSPQIYEPLQNRLYRNRGDGTFQDVSVQAGISRESGGALGVVTADLNGDGWADIYVANDGRPNQLWVNQRDGTFEDDALLAGAAVNRDGAAEGSMGVDAADFDGDGDEDLFMTHISDETNTVYVNDGQGWFQDQSAQTGLGAPSQGYTAFGTAWIDYDNDGWLDLFVANGEVKIIPALARSGDPYPLHQPNQLLRNLGNGRFVDVTAQAGEAFELSEVSRGAAFGDVDNDGDVDIVVTNNNGPSRLMLNNVGNQSHWLGLRLLTGAGRDAAGARVAVYRPSQPPLWRRTRTDGSYASANDPRVLVGLGDDTEVASVQIHWPSGRIEQWRGLPVDRYSSLREGEGQLLNSD